jgi:hypothetical protein
MYPNFTNMSTIVVHETLPNDIIDIVKDAMPISPAGAARAKNMALVDPATFDWDTVTEDTWFVVEDGKQCYYFPMYLLENQQNNFARVKNTMRMLCARGWNARQMQ